MLSARAYTLRQKARLAVSLAWVGGFVDAVGFVLLLRIFTSNMTGNTASLAGQLARGDPAAAGAFALPIACFFCGAALSGLLTVGGRRAGFRSFYALALGVEVALLGLFVLLARDLPGAGEAAGGRPPLLPVAVAALAMGLQNATITQIAGAVVRTTHVTGVITDLGLESVELLFHFHDRTRGHRFMLRLRRVLRLSARHPSLQRLGLLASLWASFLAGAALGVWTLDRLGPVCLAGPIAFLAGLVLLDAMRPIASFHPVRHTAAGRDRQLVRFGIDPALLPASVGVYRVGTGDGAAGKVRAPDLGRLAGQVAEAHRVVMLILGEEVHLEENDLAALEASARALRARSAHLVLCVGDGGTYARLREGCLGGALDPADLCTDPEFAVARALELGQEAP